MTFHLYIQHVIIKMVFCSGLSILDCVDVDESWRKLQIPFGVTEYFSLLCRTFLAGVQGSNTAWLGTWQSANSLSTACFQKTCIQASYFNSKKTLTRFHFRGQLIPEGYARLHNIFKSTLAFEILPEIRCEILPARYEVQHFPFPICILSALTPIFARLLNSNP
ncbi:hypothetical protein BC938DRAFT_480102 [Jimgerdemannia flammicorona]|uniref:Uncharacterized protein n=1 Tax=Jimgerdemannia flammicorona TaxID=994334 RepID=A0A433QJD9_9FUNG|nr:hypothetical protein BC938DRAFT_480102 [Jimgerdemannia flammicorona]